MAQGRTASQVIWFYPNVIGYSRVIFMILAFYFAKNEPLYTIGFYLAAFGGDVVDGYVARMFDQCSKFGGILDMVTDRVSTAGFLVILSNLYPDYSFVFTMLLVLDIGSHWFHVMSVSGHHKSKDSLAHCSPILKWYYSIYVLFGYCCVGAELFYVLLYAHYYFPSEMVWNICMFGCLPACVIKNFINIVQLHDAALTIAAHDAADWNKEH